jgi:hypothetical protein
LSTTFDLDEIRERNRACTEAVVRLAILRETPSDGEGPVIRGLIVKSVADVAVLGSEIEKLRAGRQKARDIHMPQTSSDPAVPGAICTGCSVHGAVVAWPCATWKALED